MVSTLLGPSGSRSADGPVHQTLCCVLGSHSASFRPGRDKFKAGGGGGVNPAMNYDPLHATETRISSLLMRRAHSIHKQSEHVLT